MSDREDLKQIVKEWRFHTDTFRKVCDLNAMLDGQIEPLILKELQKDMHEQTFKAATHRLPPINLVGKVVDKLSPIYSPGARRTIQGGTKADEELLAFIEKHMECDENFLFACQSAVLTQGSFVNPYLDQAEGKPRMRVLQKNEAFARSSDDHDKRKMTEIVLFSKGGADGKHHFRRENAFFWEEFDEDGNEIVHTNFVLTESGLFARDENGDLIEELADTTNPYGAIPYIYLNLSKISLFPPPQDDMIKMPLVIPILFTDLNYASKYQAFSILYTINCEDVVAVIAPNAIWNLKGDPSAQHPPELNVVKPDVDIEALLTLIQSQLAIWLNTKGIRPGSVGSLDKDSFASGISKMIDEMDTVELRRSLVKHATKMEREFWDLVLHRMWPEWVDRKLVTKDDGSLELRKFSKGCRVETNFADQVPLQNRGQVVDALEKEVKAAFTTRKRAIMALNPTLTEREVDELIAEIDAESASSQPASEDEGETGQPDAEGATPSFGGAEDDGDQEDEQT